MTKRNEILAIVVTYNRLSELKRCIKSLYAQTFRGFDILVVNNGSIDGTKEYLSEAKNTNLFIINQENCGGAGGFYTGQSYALENGYKWIWMMDDDGVPHEMQLETLIKCAQKVQRKFLNAIVIDKDNHNDFAFHSNGKTLNELQELEYFEDFIHPFNGTFIKTDVLNNAGLIKREMFIWGDEIELTMRYSKAGYSPITVTKAIHYHPKEKGIKDFVLPGIIKHQVLIKPRKMSKFYYRNLGYIHQVYYRTKWWKGLKPMFWYFIYFCRKLDIKEAIKVVKYYKYGLENNYTDQFVD